MPHYATIRLVGEYAEILKVLNSLPMPAESLEIFQQPVPPDAYNPLNKIGSPYPPITHNEAEVMQAVSDGGIRKLSEEESQRVRQELSKISHESLRDVSLHAEDRLEKMFQGDLSFCK